MPIPDGRGGPGTYVRPRWQGHHRRLRTQWKSNWTDAQHEKSTKESRRSENTQKGGENVPIKWSALRESEAMDMVEEFVNQAVEPLERAKIVAKEARNIANLPQYLDQRLVRLIIDIERIDYIRNSINAVRNDLPEAALEVEMRAESLGRQSLLVS